MVLRYPMMSDYARLGKKMNSLPKEEIVVRPYLLL